MARGGQKAVKEQLSFLLRNRSKRVTTIPHSMCRLVKDPIDPPKVFGVRILRARNGPKYVFFPFVTCISVQNRPGLSRQTLTRGAFLHMGLINPRAPPGREAPRYKGYFCKGTLRGFWISDFAVWRKQPKNRRKVKTVPLQGTWHYEKTRISQTARARAWQPHRPARTAAIGS